VKALTLTFVVTVVLAGVALAAPEKDTLSVTATLKSRFEVPKPAGVPAAATGRFTGTAVEQENDRARLTWRLTFSKLSGRALAAHIHIGKAGKAGGVMVGLCGPCRTGQRGTATITHTQFATIRAGRAYVNVHTAKNQAGEIRGQLSARETTSGGGTSPPPPASPPPPPSDDSPPPPPYY
jgi:hypothetical protein